MKTKKVIAFLLAGAFLLASCLPGAITAPASEASAITQPNGTVTQPNGTVTSSKSGNESWWSDAVFYEIFVRSFNDSNGDGIGDFNGITQKLDYLEKLGVGGLWLMPIFPSPSYHGYDVTDYYTVNPQYGTVDDFTHLVDEAHKRNIRIILDLVINHTSDKHPWFKASKDPASPYRDWYIWRDQDPKYNGPWGEDVWHPSATGYYYGIFTANMPDLNFRNTAVTEEIKKITSFWLKDMGVDGFRLDAVKHLLEEGTKQENSIYTHKWLKENFYPTYKAANPDALVVGELFGDNLDTIASYVKGRQFDLAFNFQLAEAFIQSANSGQASYTINMSKLSGKIMPDHQYATFLTNHDQDRLMSVLYGNVGKAKTAASLLLTSPGTPFIYYGEEIGMSGKKPDENIRLPMQWNDDANSGFTPGKPWRAPNSDYLQINTAAQLDDPASLLSHYQNLIRVRAENSALRNGKIYLLDTGASEVYAALRVNNDEIILVLINLKDEAISNYKLKLDTAVLTGNVYETKMLLGGGQARGPVGNGGKFTGYKPFDQLNPHATYIIQLIP